jgi:signal transduction histidine kinase
MASKIRSVSLLPTLHLSVRDRTGTRPLSGAHVTTRTLRTLVALAIVPMAAVTVTPALTSDHLERPVAAGLYWGYLVAVPMAIGLYWWTRRPASRFGPLLVGFGALVWVVSWQSSDVPLAFSVGVLAEAPAWAYTIYLFLAFPMGRVEPRAAHWATVATAVPVIGLFLPWALLAPEIAGFGVLTRCVPGCPENALQIASAPDVAEVIGEVAIYVAIALAAAVFAIYVARLVSASRPQRQALMAVAVTSLMFLPAFAAFHFARWVLEVDRATLDTLAWGVVGTRILLPVGFLLALLQSERFAGMALTTLLERLAARPTPERWRDAVAEALDDRSLRLGFHDPMTDAYREPSGHALVPPPPEAHQAWVPVERVGQPVAAMVIDETLTEDPELVHAAASATLLAVENGALEGELRASRARILEAANAERRRIERDLHDSAQQRLVALRVHLSLVGERLDQAWERALLERLGVEVDEAIGELRDVAHGLYPQLLGQLGPVAALEAVARRSVIPVTIRDRGLARHAEPVETTIYFCCVECLQNAAKHAGPGASVAVELGERDGHVTFSVTDDGMGFDPAGVHLGAGLTNLSDRVAAVGGTIRIDAHPGAGTRITGTIPAS